MGGRCTLAGLLAIVAAVALVALPADALAKHKPKAPKPPSGTWTMTGDAQQTSASFTVSGGKVSNVQIAISSSAATDCGTGTVTIAGPEPMHVVKGGPGNKPEYIVGKADKVVPQSAYVPHPLKVNVTVNGQTFPGQLEIGFRNPKATPYAGFGMVTYLNPAYPASYGACEFDDNLVLPT